MDVGSSKEHLLQPLMPHQDGSVAVNQCSDVDNQQENESPQMRRHWFDTIQAIKTPDLPLKEKAFFKELIAQYLYPLEKDEQHEERVKKDLLELRNKTFLAFALINCLFVVLVFMLQQVAKNTPNLTIKLDCSLSGFRSEGFEPISMAFMVVFGIVLVIQFFAMLVHRISTFLHIAADADIQDLAGAKLRGPLNGKTPGLTPGVYVDWVKQMQKVKPSEENVPDLMIVEQTDPDTETDVDKKAAQREKEKWQRLNSRKTIKRVATRNNARRTLDQQFTKVFTQLADEQLADEQFPEKQPSSPDSTNVMAMKRFRRAMSDGDSEDPLEAISRAATADDHLRRTIVRKATIMKKAVSFNLPRGRRRQRRREDEETASENRDFHVFPRSSDSEDEYPAADSAL